MGTFLSKKLTHNMGPFVRKFSLHSIQWGLLQLKILFVHFFLSNFFNFFFSSFFFFLFFFFFSIFFFFLNFPGGGDGLRLPPPAGAHAYACYIRVCVLYTRMRAIYTYVCYIHVCVHNKQRGSWIQKLNQLEITPHPVIFVSLVFTR